MNQSGDPKKDYFDYLENVLGLKSVMLGAGARTPAQTELLICVENYQSYQADEIDLLQKMLAALKVDSSRLMIVDLEERNQIQKKVTVLFTDEPFALPSSEGLTVQTFSPRVLLNKPELKKVAWVELQKVLQFFANSSTEV